MRVLSFGEILFDIIEGENYLGGAPLNFAAHLAQLGVESYIFSRVGDDELGKAALEQIRKIRIKTDFIQKDNQHPTGTVPVEFKDGQPDYTITKNVAYDYINFRASKQAIDPMSFDVLYFGTLAQRNLESESALKQLLQRKAFKHIFYDINLRKDCFTAEIIKQSLRACTIFKLNDEEVRVVSALLYQQELSLEEFVKQASKDNNIELILITAGAEGCYIYEKQTLKFVKGYPANVVDTVGAGDSFSAAFVHHYLREKNALQAADVSNRLGAFVASSRGPLPTYSSEIKRILGIVEP
ncbi:carbohydrate kinase family protein [Nafulsella turpanensis]|uniref:carbohydrate kinase family protein n=1 Tax=Nafulsella turpanensis TaxID=1265690 RepID=UPI0003461BB1|nr:carbohydrate kinase [Nafulsella turpanensis]